MLCGMVRNNTATQVLDALLADQSPPLDVATFDQCMPHFLSGEDVWVMCFSQCRPAATITSSCMRTTLQRGRQMARSAENAMYQCRRCVFAIVRERAAVQLPQWNA